MSTKKALLIGATGLIGKALLNQLLEDPAFSEVRVIARKKTGLQHPKLREHLIDFSKIQEAKDLFVGDVLFSTLGTTLKTAGSKEKQYAIDYTMQYLSAKFACENQTNQFILLSSAGANAQSNLFYPKMKGELDEAVQKLGFKQVAILRPSMLVGNRGEFRWSEKIFTPIMYGVTWIPGLRKYRPIKDVVVAKAMINASKSKQESNQIYELDQLFELAKNQ
jgi:uncharacterized protein YbjT (DUF2867 family)